MMNTFSFVCFLSPGTDSLTSTQIASIAAGLVGLVLLIVVLVIVIVGRRRHRRRRHKLDISNPMSPEPLLDCINSSSALVARQLSADSNCDDSPTANASGSSSRGSNSNNNNDVTLEEIDLITIDQQPLYSHPVWRGDASQCSLVGGTLTVMNASYDSVDDVHLKPVL